MSDSSRTELDELKEKAAWFDLIRDNYAHRNGMGWFLSSHYIGGTLERTDGDTFEGAMATEVLVRELRRQGKL